MATVDEKLAQARAKLESQERQVGELEDEARWTLANNQLQAVVNNRTWDGLKKLVEDAFERERQERHGLTYRKPQPVKPAKPATAFEWPVGVSGDAE